MARRGQRQAGGQTNDEIRGDKLEGEITVKMRRGEKEQRRKRKGGKRRGEKGGRPANDEAAEAAGVNLA